MNIKDIPAEVASNPTINTYTVLSEHDALLFQAKRKAHPDDKPSVVEGEVIKCNGYYFGDWYDNTAAAKEELKAKKPKTFHKPSEVVATAQQKREEELAQAEALLAAFGNKEDK